MQLLGWFGGGWAQEGGVEEKGEKTTESWLVFVEKKKNINNLNPEEYFFAEIDKISVESIEEEIRSHWQSGIYLMGTIKITEEEHVGLFRRER